MAHDAPTARTPSIVDPLSFAVTLPAVPESVAVVRHLVGGTAGHWSVSEALLHDIRVAVSEVCTDVVRRAGQAPVPGTMEIRAGTEEDSIVIRVRDPAPAAPASVEPRDPGMLLAAALTESLQVDPGPDGAPLITMTFATADPAR